MRGGKEDEVTLKTKTHHLILLLLMRQGDIFLEVYLVTRTQSTCNTLLMFPRDTCVIEVRVEGGSID